MSSKYGANKSNRHASSPNQCHVHHGEIQYSDPPISTIPDVNFMRGSRLFGAAQLFSPPYERCMLILSYKKKSMGLESKSSGHVTGPSGENISDCCANPPFLHLSIDTTILHSVLNIWRTPPVCRNSLVLKPQKRAKQIRGTV